MNIIDMISGIKPAENEFSKKIAYRNASKKIERFSDELIDSLIDRIRWCLDDLISQRNSDLLSDSERESLVKKLKEQVASTPDKFRSALNDIFGTNSDERKSDERTSEEKPSIVSTQNNIPVSSVSSIGFSSFGY